MDPYRVRSDYCVTVVLLERNQRAPAIAPDLNDYPSIAVDDIFWARVASSYVRESGEVSVVLEVPVGSLPAKEFVT